MRILVTGGAGFIGSNFVHYILNEHDDDEVVTVDSLTYAGSKDNLGEALEDPRHKFVNGDIRDKSLVTDLVSSADAVVNFAAESHVDRSIDSAEPFVTTNIQGTQTLLDAARDSSLDRFIQVSTDEVYGQIVEGAFSESDPLNPRNPYSATKAGADLLAQSFQTTYDLPVIITRSCNNFGPRQHSEKLIPKFIKRSIRGEQLPIYGDGSNVREWIYVEDNCRALDLVLREGDVGEVYNVGSGVEKTNLEVTKEIVKIVGADEQLIKFVDDRPSHDQRYALEINKIKDLGWKANMGFERGLRETVEYYKENIH